MIMRRAWVIARTTGKAFAVALAKSWQLYRLVKQMQAGLCGSLTKRRTAHCAAPSEHLKTWRS